MHIPPSDFFIGVILFDITDKVILDRIIKKQRKLKNLA
jgi:hypothetical protein